jgi:LmbE family N-acetylglucosaminyl deacetylase
MTAATPARQPDWFEAAPLLPAERACDPGPTLVGAPHPDDEALGCSGAVALLRQADVPVRAIVVSDGAASHPGSSAYPPPDLAELRRAETLAGLAILGVSPGDVQFLGLPDGAIPTPERPGGPEAITLIRNALLSWPDTATVLLPWRRDPHDDHRATWALTTGVMDRMMPARNTVEATVRRLEYPIWARVHPGPTDLPTSSEGTTWRLDIGAALDRKRDSVLAHRSQTTGLIDDAQIGECLTPEVLARFFVPWDELFLFRT